MTMKKIFVLFIALVAFSITTSAQNIVQVGSGSVRQLCVGEGNKVYFLDYDAIRNNKNDYWKYTIGNSNATKVTLNNTVAINGDLFRGDSSNISLDNVYNKVSVKDKFYKFSDIIPDIYDTAYNITKSSDATLSSSTNINNGMYGEVVEGIEGNNIDDSNNNMICMIDRVYDPENERYTDFNAVFVKYFNHPNYRFYSYHGSNSASLNYTDTKNFYGAVIAKFYVDKLDKTYYDSWLDIIGGGNTLTNHTLDDWMAKNQISNISFNNYVMMLNPYEHHISNNDILSYPYFETISSDTTALFGGDNANLVITGTKIFFISLSLYE